MSITKLKVKNIHYLLIIAGLVCILIANLFNYSVYKIDIDAALANLGVLLFLIGGIQWLYDLSVRQQLYEEITSLTVRNINIVTSGIEDVISNSKDVNYSDPIKQSTLLVIGLNYTPRILEDYFDEFKERAKSGLDSTIVAIDIASKAGEMISSKEDDSEHIVPNLKKLKSIVREINSLGKGKIKILNHSSILRYSFVKTDSAIWFKPYRNSEGRYRIPAICLKNGTSLYQFYNSDIELLIEQAVAS